MVLKPHVWGRVIAYTMFALVILAVVLGIGYIVAHGLGYADDLQRHPPGLHAEVSS